MWVRLLFTGHSLVWSAGVSWLPMAALALAFDYPRTCKCISTGMVWPGPLCSFLGVGKCPLKSPLRALWIITGSNIH